MISPTVTDNVDEFEAALGRLTVYNGGDCPERSLAGLKKAVQLSGLNSFVFLFTDAPPKDSELENEVVDLVQALNIKVSDMW